MNKKTFGDVHSVNVFSQGNKWVINGLGALIWRSEGGARSGDFYKWMQLGQNVCLSVCLSVKWAPATVQLKSCESSHDSSNVSRVMSCNWDSTHSTRYRDSTHMTRRGWFDSYDSLRRHFSREPEGVTCSLVKVEYGFRKIVRLLSFTTVKPIRFLVVSVQDV